MKKLILITGIIFILAGILSGADVKLVSSSGRISLSA